MNFSHWNGSAEAVIDALWRASWQGAVALSMVWIICRLFTRLPATVKTWLWRLATLKMFIALFWIAPINLEVLQPEPPQFASTPKDIVDLNISAPSEPASKPWGEAAAEPYTPLPNKPVSHGPNHPQSEWASPSDPISPLLAAPAPIPIQTTPALTLPVTLVLIWATAVFAFLIRFAVQLTNARRLLRSTAVASNPLLLQMVVELCRDLKIRRTPRLLITSNSTSPFLIGILRPTLVFPRAILNSAPPETLRMMLAHELAHLQRHDLFWLAFHAVAQALFWFHPLVWIARREAALAQEIACDELAIRTTASPPHRYADMLLQVITRNTTTEKPNLFAAAVATNKNSVERRIRTMKFAGTKQSAALKILGAATLAAAVLSLVPIRLVAEKPASASQLASPKPPPTAKLLEQLRALPPAELRQVLPTVHHDPLLNEHLAKFARLEQEYAAAEHGNFGEDHPEVRKLTSMLAQVNKQIDNRIEGILAGLEIQAAARNPDIVELNLDPSAGPASAAPSMSLSEAELLQEQINQAEAHLKSTQQMVEAGRSSRDELFERQKAIHNLRIDQARLENDPAAVEKALEEAIAESEEYLKYIQAQIDEGRAPQSALAKPQSEILRLKQQIARIQSSTPEASNVQPTWSQKNSVQLIKVHARVGGIVQHVHAKLGEKVQAGQLLLQLDDAEALAAYRTLEAGLKVVEAGHLIAQVEFKQVEKAHTNPNPFDSNKPNLAKAEAVLLKSAAELEVAKLQLEESNVQLQHYHVRSPVSGIVQKIVPVGDWIPEGGGKILAIISYSEPPAQQDPPK